MSTEPGSAPPGQPWLEGQLCCAPSCLEKQPVLMAITWEKGPGGWGQGGAQAEGKGEQQTPRDDARVFLYGFTGRILLVKNHHM